MTLRLSTGLVTKMLDTSSLKTLLSAGFIDIYSGAQPTLPDNAPTGTLLCTIYSDGTAAGLHFATNAVAGVLSKLSSETWSCNSAVASGTAGWFRFREATDSGLSISTTACRLDGAISTSGAEMNLGSLSITAGAPFVISAATITLPQQ